jgi:hypothetical protein
MYWIGHWELLHFSAASSPDKKYSAVIKERSSNRMVNIDFGKPGFWHFHDVTGLGLYSHLDRKCPERRQKFRDRYAKFVQADITRQGISVIIFCGEMPP